MVFLCGRDRGKKTLKKMKIVTFICLPTIKNMVNLAPLSHFVESSRFVSGVI
jgi:hypothetical protein